MRDRVGVRLMSRPSFFSWCFCVGPTEQADCGGDAVNHQVFCFFCVFFGGFVPPPPPPRVIFGTVFCETAIDCPELNRDSLGLISPLQPEKGANTADRWYVQGELSIDYDDDISKTILFFRR